MQLMLEAKCISLTRFGSSLIATATCHVAAHAGSEYISLVSAVTCASCRSTPTAHTLVSSSVSTQGQPPSTSWLARGSGSGTPGGGSRNCRLNASATYKAAAAAAAAAAGCSSSSSSERSCTDMLVQVA
jgi:hypothetical protein